MTGSSASSPADRQAAAEATSHDHDRTLGASLSADDFKALFRGHPGGVAVITAEGPDGPVALTATSVSSVSVDPPLLIFSVSALSSATPAILAADTIVVHLLDGEDLDVAQLAATSGIDRFADRTRWSRLVTGEPVYHGVRAWVRCSIVERMNAGGSTVIAAHALQSDIARDVEPGEHGNALVYHNRTWHRLGDHSRVDG
ncbi:MAG: flavin reductase family protein [Microbacterium sp.]|uniref:flavin reductase family protein n=1 Tax=Microbacterium sp. TaxID=51671 RepID=UPI0026074DE0|nr:flavin reductase family protein [Microbacterium sp.]MCX6502320.1 flavin reductase family protein [Microbacterium sp.]